MVDKSITTKLLTPVREWMVTLVPPTIAPTVLSLTALLSVIQAWYVCIMYSESFPEWVSFAGAALGTIFWCLHSIQSLHARQQRQDTAVTELFGYVCDNLATVFLMLVFCMLLGLDSLESRWYVVQTGQLVLMRKHMSAFSRKCPPLARRCRSKPREGPVLAGGGGVRHRMFTGPGEAMCLYLIMLVVRGTMGLEWLGRIYLRAWVALIGCCNGVFGNQLPIDVDDPWQVASDSIRAFYYLNVAHTFFDIALIGTGRKGGHKETRFGLFVCMLVRTFPAFAVTFLGAQLTPQGVVYDGIFLTAVIADVTVAKMARRELHPWVVMMAMASIFNHFVILVLVTVYYVVIFADICHYMNLPLLSCCRNVYCDGVYDLCHIGHKNAFRNALAFGNRLFVGVCGDADCATYKRPPVMSHAERCAEVEACKSVTKVIPNAPTFGLTKEFLDKHRIHVVAMGAEYAERWPDPKDDKYYSVPRIMGIARLLPRTKTLSTSDLIARIQVRCHLLLRCWRLAGCSVGWRLSDEHCAPPDRPAGGKQRLG